MSSNLTYGRQVVKENKHQFDRVANDLSKNGMKSDQNPLRDVTHRVQEGRLAAARGGNKGAVLQGGRN
jgi:hypothetical protein